MAGDAVAGDIPAMASEGTYGTARRVVYGSDDGPSPYADEDSPYRNSA